MQNVQVHEKHTWGSNREFICESGSGGSVWNGAEARPGVRDGTMALSVPREAVC